MDPGSGGGGGGGSSSGGSSSDSAPDCWDQADMEAPGPGPCGGGGGSLAAAAEAQRENLSAAFSRQLNVNAKPFVPNVHAAEFVPSFLRGPAAPPPPAGGAANNHGAGSGAGGPAGSQNNDKRQFLLERLLDAVKQCQIRFGGRKEIASDSDSRVTCLCAQFEAVLQHGLKRSRGLALTAAAIKQAAGFASKTETEPVFWYYVKEVLNKHELQRFYSLRHIASDVGRGRAWLRCALNEHSLERYLHMLLADRCRLSTFYEDWSFVMDEERSSMLPTMAAGLNSILFAINIDNKDLNGQSKFAPTVSDLLKESTQNVTSLLKESTQGVSSLFREITASSAVSILIKPEQETDPLPVVSRNVSADAKCKKERKKKKKVTNIISFDDEEDEQNSGDVFKKTPGAGESSEDNSDRSSVNIMSAFESPFGPNSNGSQSSNSWKIDSLSLNGEFGYQKLDVKSIDDEDVDENEDDVYGNSSGRKHRGHLESPEK
nr:sorting nexin-29-like isoform X12 [Gorilla gorilla gorilla]